MVKTVGKVSIQPSGQWVKANTYKKLQLVSNLGSSYLAIQPVPANTEIDNTSYWMMIASKGDKGNTGKSIQTITKTGTVGLVDTYTILYSDLTTSTFTVNNGNGVTGIEVEKTGTAGNVDTYTMTITMASGSPYTATFTITNGEDGDVQASAIAEPYDNTVAYKVGNLLTYLGKQYEVTGKDGVAPPVGTLPTDTDYFTERPVSEIIDMIKNGTIVTGHSQVADNLTPYSEDSGTTQENPFISQGTGTDNNSVIVTTGVIARQLEKQGNTIVKNQLVRNLVTKTSADVEITGNDTTHKISFVGTTSQILNTSICTSITTIAGHKYLFLTPNKPSDIKISLAYDSNDLGNSVFTASSSSTSAVSAYVAEGVTLNSEFELYIVDLTQWGFSSDIITDLTSHPEHFSWYYKDSMSYDAGSLQNCNGRYLECGQGR